MTISFFSFIFSLTKGFSSDSEYLISNSEKPLIVFRKLTALTILMASPDIVPFMPSEPTKIVP